MLLVKYTSVKYFGDNSYIESYCFTLIWNLLMSEVQVELSSNLTGK